ncbi:MAG: DUF4124 domain-containing protein, partial [Caldimonas sp.]
MSPLRHARPRILPVSAFAAALMVAAAPLAWAEPAAGGGRIYSCIDANGKPLTSDRPIPECANREQRILNADGSLNRIQPPTPTADEQSD